MERRQQFHPSQGPVTDSSQTEFTPSETLPSREGSMIDVSQLSARTDPGDLGTSNDSASYDNNWPMDVDFNLLPGIGPFFERDGIGAIQVEQIRNQSAAIGYGQVVVPNQYPSKSFPGPDPGCHFMTSSGGMLLTGAVPDYYDSSITSPAVVPQNDQVSNMQTYFHNQKQMINQLATFDRTYHHIPVTQHLASTAYLNDQEPRHVPGTIHTTAGPWSPYIASELGCGVHPVSELIYEPAMDGRLADQNPQSYGDPEGYVDSDPDTLMEEDAFRHDPAFHEINVGPPPPPDPIGPPFDTADGEKDHSLENHKSRLVGGRRQGPLDPRSRRNAQTTRQRGGQCWSCTLQRGQVRSSKEIMIDLEDRYAKTIAAVHI